MLTVMNLVNGDKYLYSKSISPKEALIRTYVSITLKMNFFVHEHIINKYRDKIQESKYCYVLGDFSVFKDGREF